MPEEGVYLLTHVGFTHSGEPILSLQRSGTMYRFNPVGRIMSLRFDPSQRYCTGWYDMRASESHPCPDAASIAEKYDQCSACQQRTGFNPAFYNASSVSSQQEDRNQEPHILYLAHFGKGITKVGISHAARGDARLLEQGARSAIILDTFPTALVARQYEAKIAAMPGIAETIQLRKKILSLSQSYNQADAHAELQSVRTNVELALKTSFSEGAPRSFDDIYFPSDTPDLSQSFDTSNHSGISGHITGMLGPLLFSTQDDTPLFLPIKKYTGYNVTLSYTPFDIPLPSQQMSFF